MKTQILSALVLTLSAATASADIIKCVFTEPFVNTTYSMAQQTLTIKMMDEKSQVLRNVSFQIRAPGKFEIVDKAGKVIQQLTLNFAGSDGMSDNIYPYSVVHLPMKSGANNGVGGCSSNYLKPVQQ